MLDQFVEKLICDHSIVINRLPSSTLISQEIYISLKGHTEVATRTFLVRDNILN